MNVGREMPRYRCHKEVWALKIIEVIHKPNPDTTGQSAASSYGATIVPAEPGYAAFDVPPEYVNKHQPEAGGYYVVYADGYASYSPAKAFEEGYTPIRVLTDADAAADLAGTPRPVREVWTVSLLPMDESTEFWMVWSPQGTAPTAKHDTEGSAIREAERLARAHPARQFYVLQAVHLRVVDDMKRVRLTDAGPGF